MKVHNFDVLSDSVQKNLFSKIVDIMYIINMIGITIFILNWKLSIASPIITKQVLVRLNRTQHFLHKEEVGLLVSTLI
jgi:hypothetical protein